MKVVIIGGVAGGAGAAARLRRNDENAQIIMLERNGFISFANCGLPYYLGDVITERKELVLMTPEHFHARFNVDVRVMHEVLSVDTAAKTVTVHNRLTDEQYTESYDKLIVAPGAGPIRPPFAGMDPAKVFTLRNLEDTFRIKDYMTAQKPCDVAIVGGGYIGLEMAENMVNAGHRVHIIEAASHVITTLDADMAHILHNRIRAAGVDLRLGEKVVGFRDGGVALESGEIVPSNMTILSIGVRPETKFLQSSGIALGARGEILVDEQLRTSAPDVFALGDAVAVTNIVSGKKQTIALASPANKQARIVADVVCGKPVRYTGAQGTAIAKVFGAVVGVTGLGEDYLCANGTACAKSITISASNASYYPGADMMFVKLIFDPRTGRLFGGQIVGGKGVDKRTDVLAVAIRAKMNVFDLQELELAYAPPFSSAKDPVNMAGYAAGNIVEGTFRPFFAEALDGLDDSSVLVDVRTDEEFAQGHIPGAIHCELEKMRGQLDMLPKDKELITYCRVGLRGYVAERLLEQKGYKVRNLAGGWLYYEQMMQDRDRRDV